MTRRILALLRGPWSGSAARFRSLVVVLTLTIAGALGLVQPVAAQEVRSNNPLVGLVSANSGAGYWQVASDGGVFAFGDARSFGSAGSLRLSQPVVGMARTPSGNGYWLVAADGGVFNYGDAAFRGSAAALRLNQPVVGMASTPTGNGYWLVAADGGIFAYGDARFYRLHRQPAAQPARRRHGRHTHRQRLLAGRRRRRHLRLRRRPLPSARPAACALNQPVVGMASTPTGHGYWLVAARRRHLRLRRRPLPSARPATCG